MRDFEGIPKTCGPVLSGLKTLGKPTFNNTLQLVFQTVPNHGLA